jgi:hypothetical protein
MSNPPPRPKLYHITPVENLPSIVADGALVSDAEMIARGGPTVTIGMSTIKKRRVEELVVHCQPGNKVGEYVPFYFGPRSVMLYLIHRGNHPDLTYRGGQERVVHLEADLVEVVEWASEAGRPWAFSLSNAGSRYARFRDKVEQLSEVDWEAVANPDFTSATVKEGKQAEFLVYGEFPWSLVTRIGVLSVGVQSQTEQALEGATHRPVVDRRPDWYY